MKKFKIYYTDEYYIKGEDGIKHRVERATQTVYASDAEEAEKIFQQNMCKVFALFMVIGHNITVKDVQEIYEPYFNDETKQKILKDFMKKC